MAGEQRSVFQSVVEPARKSLRLTGHGPGKYLQSPLLPFAFRAGLGPT
jgi:hypothetical protein